MDEDKNLLELLSTIQKYDFDSRLILHGSTVLYLNKIISRKPNDLDVLLDSNINLQQKNKYVNSFLSNFEIINFSKKTELIKKCKIKFNSQEFKLEFILEKNIDSKFITDSSRLRTTNSLYFLPSKFTQLAYIIGVDFANEIKKRRKINQILSDMVEIIQKIDYDNKLVGYILDNIKSNLCYQIISLRKHYYNNLLSLNNYLRRNNYFVNSRLSILFKNLSLNVGLNKFLNILNKIFIIKNDFFIMWFRHWKSQVLKKIKLWNYFFSQK
ncbi:hypothetical protein [Metamycoplasma equirhinis]|uniref:hypothetical protein n=1 Tax=Metamycoplasma equirhinis TaxID=92402 RepID=UPI00359C17A3